MVQYFDYQNVPLCNIIIGILKKMSSFKSFDSIIYRRTRTTASCCRQRWTISVINQPSTVADNVNLFDRRRSTPAYDADRLSELTARCDDRRAVANFYKFSVQNKITQGNALNCVQTPEFACNPV